MARIWPVYEGREPTRRGPWAELPVSDAVTLLELRPSDFVADLEAPPRFGNLERDLWYGGHKHVVVEIANDESRHTKWRPGFYRSRVSPSETFVRLLRRALASELGKQNVLRVELEDTVDSHGQEALRITAVITPAAVRRFKDRALDALVKVHEQLRDMGDDRVPIVEFATEAELAEDARSQP